jgi:hypothetical protein
MEAEGVESSKMAPATASSARRGESTPAPASTTLAPALVDPAPLEQGAIRSPPSSAVYVPQDAVNDAADGWEGFFESGSGFMFRSAPPPPESDQDVASRSGASHSSAASGT